MCLPNLLLIKSIEYSELIDYPWMNIETLLVDIPIYAFPGSVVVGLAVTLTFEISQRNLQLGSQPSEAPGT